MQSLNREEIQVTRRAAGRVSQPSCRRHSTHGAARVPVATGTYLNPVDAMLLTSVGQDVQNERGTPNRHSRFAGQATTTSLHSACYASRHSCILFLSDSRASAACGRRGILGGRAARRAVLAAYTDT